MADVHGPAAFLLKHGYVDLESISRSVLPADPTLLIEHHWPAARDLARTVVPGAGQKLQSAELRPPIRRPGAILGIRHELTTGHRPHTAVFGKFPGSVTGPYDDIVLPDPARLPMRAE